MSEQKAYARKALAKAVRAALPTDKKGWGEIANPLHSGGTGNILGAADELLDLKRGKFQDEINDEVETELAKKPAADNVYTKSEADGKLDAKADADTVYTKTETDTAIGKKANTADVYAKADVYNKTEIDEKLKAAQGTIWSLQAPVADKAALYAIAEAKKGYVYNVNAAVTVGNDTYPAKTNFVVIADFTGATTDENFDARFDSLGGVFNMDAINSDINKLYNIMFANHAQASIRITSGLTNNIIEKGVETTVGVAWSYGVNGITGEDAKPTSVKVQKSTDGGKTFADWVADGLAASSKTDKLTDSATYKVVASFPHGASKEGSVSVAARYPIYVVCSAKTELVSTDIVAADGDDHKKYLLDAPGSGREVKVTNSTDAQYIWVCVPAGMKISKMMMGGQPMTYEAAATVAVTGKGNYLAYRSSFSQDAGAKTFQIWG